MSLQVKILVGLAVISASLLGALIVLRVCGLVRPFSVPTGAMTPAVSAGDHILMENLTFLFTRPRRADIVVFKTDSIASLPPAQNYVKRIAGEPGDHVRISEGRLFVNDMHVSLSNAVGEIVYELPPHDAASASAQTDVAVPSGHYFVLGDNSTNSLDSRFYCGVARGNIMGRVVFCDWPPWRIGGVK